jgi:hypothetical protein
VDCRSERRANAPVGRTHRATASIRRAIGEILDLEANKKDAGLVTTGRSHRALRRYAEIFGGTLEIDLRLVDMDDEAA